MVDYPIINASETTAIEVPVVTQTETIIYDRWFQCDFGVQARDPNAPVNAVAMMTKGRKLANGTWELSPNEADTVYVTISDIFTLAETDEDVAECIQKVLALVVKFGTQQGKL